MPALAADAGLVFGDVCVICQDDYMEGDVLRELKCGTAVPHLFHVECIDRWLITCATKQRELSCPLCNTRV